MQLAMSPADPAARLESCRKAVPCRSRSSRRPIIVAGACVRSTTYRKGNSSTPTSARSSLVRSRRERRRPWRRQGILPLHPRQARQHGRSARIASSRLLLDRRGSTTAIPRASSTTAATRTADNSQCHTTNTTRRYTTLPSSRFERSRRARSWCLTIRTRRLKMRRQRIGSMSCSVAIMKMGQQGMRLSVVAAAKTAGESYGCEGYAHAKDVAGIGRGAGWH
ncbi:hypothetical protein MRB53_037361 [Persea americana]|nr:hypothetical protein MRB53_037361 [Persea americana]